MKTQPQTQLTPDASDQQLTRFVRSRATGLARRYKINLCDAEAFVWRAVDFALRNYAPEKPNGATFHTYLIACVERMALKRVRAECFAVYLPPNPVSTVERVDVTVLETTPAYDSRADAELLEDRSYRVANVLRRLSPNDRQILEWHSAEKLTFDAIRTRLAQSGCKIGYGSVRRRWWRALKRAREIVRKDELATNSRSGPFPVCTPTDSDYIST